MTIASRSNTSGLAKPQLLVTPARRLAQPATADTYVRGGEYQNRTFGTATILEVKDSGPVAYDRQTYLRWDLRALNSSSVHKATLRLYYGQLANTTPAALQVRGVASDSWSESSTIWTNRPESGAQVASTTLTSRQGGWIELDVTAYVNAQLTAANDKQASFALLDTTLSDSLVAFNSRENGANRPVLELIVP